MRFTETVINADRILCADSGISNPRFLTISNTKVEGIYNEMPKFHHQEVIDFTGCVIAPLFCDYHLHFPINDERLMDAARSLTYHGVFAAYDGGSRIFRKYIPNILEREHLYVRTAGTALFKAGGYGRFIGSPVGRVEQACELIDVMKEKIDYLKIVNSGIYDPENDRITPGGFEYGMLREIVSFARASGLKVWCHANGSRAVMEAVEAGVSAIIHGLYVDEPALYLMASKGAAFVPTIAAFKSLAKRAHTQVAIDNVNRAVKQQQRAAKQAFEMGVKVLPGSDSGPDVIPYGESYLEELSLLVEAGIPYERVIESASAFKFREGVSADFVVLDGLRIRAIYLYGNSINI